MNMREQAEVEVEAGRGVLLLALAAAVVGCMEKMMAFSGLLVLFLFELFSSFFPCLAILGWTPRC